MKPTVLYEDDSLLVIDKPAGLIVHEGAGHANEQGENKPGYLLTDWIRKEKPEIVNAFAIETADLYFRPGIVHRLDKDTSGLLVLAKIPAVKKALQQLFKDREVIKEYTTLVLGQPTPEQGRIETFINRNPHHRRQMAVSLVDKGKEAVTDYETRQRWQYLYKGQKIPLSFLKITLHSGRMHQIRVHMKHKGHPVLGDQTYQTKPSRNISKELGLSRQFLHASRLSFIHPETEERLNIISPLPNDLQKVIDQLDAKS